MCLAYLVHALTVIDGGRNVTEAEEAEAPDFYWTRSLVLSFCNLLPINRTIG